KPERFGQVLLACECDARGRLGLEARPYAPRERLRKALEAALSVATEPIAQAAVQRGAKGPEIGAAIGQARTAAVAQALERPEAPSLS
ncbi:MAG TPA: multifunctional CCA tRNA nucleotidyl transferase/2'3'-cyclic phosphodiesterase/2'nucleotidase/phosphatase, partial [Ramlibacter sp.]